MQMVARFADLPEANIAASMLRAYGLHPDLPEQISGGNLWTHSTAFGGFRLMVPDDELDAAAGLIRGSRTSDAESLNWRDHPEAITSVPNAALGLAVGWPAVALKQKPDALRWTVFMIGAAGAAFFWTVWILRDG